MVLTDGGLAVAWISGMMVFLQVCTAPSDLVLLSLTKPTCLHICLSEHLKSADGLQ